MEIVVDDDQLADPNLLGGGDGGDHGGRDGGEGDGDGVFHLDLIKLVEQIVQALQNATGYIEAAQYWINDGVVAIGNLPEVAIGNLPEVAVRPSRAVQSIRDCQLRFAQSLGQIQQAIDVIVPMFQVPVIEPFPQVMETVAEAHDVINAALVGLHGNLLVLLKAQVHHEAQARIQMGLTLLHNAVGFCKFAIATFDFLYDGHDWDFGEAEPLEQA